MTRSGRVYPPPSNWQKQGQKTYKDFAKAHKVQVQAYGASYEEMIADAIDKAVHFFGRLHTDHVWVADTFVAMQVYGGRYTATFNVAMMPVEYDEPEPSDDD